MLLLFQMCKYSCKHVFKALKTPRTTNNKNYISYQFATFYLTGPSHFLDWEISYVCASTCLVVHHTSEILTVGVVGHGPWGSFPSHVHALV